MSQSKGVVAGFRSFVMRGNVIDLAVAVVVGAAFTAFIGSFTAEIIDPVIAAFGGVDTGGVGFCIRPSNPCTPDAATFVDLGAVLGAALSMLITMAVVYFVFVAPMARLRNRTAQPDPEPEPEVPADVALLTEIRDLLAERRDS